MWIGGLGYMWIGGLVDRWISGSVETLRHNHTRGSQMEQWEK
jgi:hypothetical protein